MRKCLGRIFDSEIDSASSKHFQPVTETAHMPIGEVPCEEYPLRYSVDALAKADMSAGARLCWPRQLELYTNGRGGGRAVAFFFLQHICSVDSFYFLLPVPRAPLLTGVI